MPKECLDFLAKFEADRNVTMPTRSRSPHRLCFSYYRSRALLGSMFVQGSLLEAGGPSANNNGDPLAKRVGSLADLRGAQCLPIFCFSSVAFNL